MSDPARDASLGELFDRFADGWSEVTFRGRRYGVTSTRRVGGRSRSLYAEELGADDVVSANLYTTTDGESLHPCEMPTEVVMAFLIEATPEP